MFGDSGEFWPWLMEAKPNEGAPFGDPGPPRPLLPLPPLAASKAALYEEAGANEGIDWDKYGELDSGPNEGGELIEEPNEALNGECEPWPCGPPWFGEMEPCCCCCCCCCDEPPSEPNGNEGEIENVEPPKLNDGPDGPKRLCDGTDWLALNDSKGDCGDGWLCCCCDCCCCGGLKRLQQTRVMEKRGRVGVVNWFCVCVCVSVWAGGKRVVKLAGKKMAQG